VQSLELSAERELVASYRLAVMTSVRVRPSITPWPNRASRARSAASVACCKPDGSRASISLRKGVPEGDCRITRGRCSADTINDINGNLHKTDCTQFAANCLLLKIAMWRSCKKIWGIVRKQLRHGLRDHAGKSFSAIRSQTLKKNEPPSFSTL